jgi:hypothetical protein
MTDIKKWLVKKLTQVLQHLTLSTHSGKDFTDIFGEILKEEPDFWYKHDYGFIAKVLKTPGASDRDRTKALKLLANNFSGFPTNIDFRDKQIKDYLEKKNASI